MLSLRSGFNYYLCDEPVTLRYRIDGLCRYIKGKLHKDPRNGDVYIFRSADNHCFVGFFVIDNADINCVIC